MKKLLKIFTALILTVTLLQAAAFEKTVQGGKTEVTISSEKPLTPGSNTLLLHLKYKDAKVKVKAFMPEMPGMPRMEQEVEAKSLGNGNYEARIDFSMSGTWQVWIYIAPAEGKKVRIKTSLNI
ncbi:FixH family protein [Sulfurimonas sp. HSL-1716]|uniref:FixH family protein n=1 Tax=Hydrocurvibacter sulfurireducens TaxID=3131937 RepID=UPI0031F815C3